MNKKNNHDPLLKRRHAEDQGRLRRILNIPWLLGTLIFLAIVVPGVYFTYVWQVSRTARTLLTQADTFAKEKKWSDAAEYLFRYLELCPQDVQARIQLALLYSKAFKDPRGRDRAENLCYQALAVAPVDQQTPLRQQLGDLLLAGSQLPGAEKEARILLAANPSDPAGSRILAASLLEQHNLGTRSTGLKADESISSLFEKAVKLNPENVELSSILAEIYRKDPRKDAGLLDKELLEPKKNNEDRAKLADAVMNEMVSAASTNPIAYLARFRYRTRYNLPEATEDLRQALDRGPKNPEVLITAAENAYREAYSLDSAGSSKDDVKKKLAEAGDFYNRLIEVSPKDVRGYQGCGEIFIKLGQTDKAIEVWRRGLEPCGADSFSLNANLAGTLIAQQKFDEAKKFLDAIRDQRKNLNPAAPNSVKSDVGRTCDVLQGEWHLRRNEIGEAIESLKRVANGQVSTPSESTQAMRAWMLLGEAYEAWKYWDQSASAYEQATRLQPENIDALHAVARAWLQAGRPEMAIRYCRQALGSSNSAEFCLALADALFQSQSLLPKEERNWREFREAMKAAKDPKWQPPLKEPWRLQMLEAKSALLTTEDDEQREQKIRETVEMVRGLEKQYSESAVFLQTIADFYERQNLPDDTDRILALLEKSSDRSSADYRLLRSRILAGRKNYDRARDLLQAGIKDSSPSEQAAFREELVRIDVAEKGIEQLPEQMKKLSEQMPSDPDPVRQLAEYALATGNWKDLEACEQKFRKLEGAGSISSRYYEACRMLGQSKDADDPKLSIAAKLQASVANDRPQWSAVHTLDGRILEMQRSFTQAADAYVEAIRLGERNPAVYERLAALLSRLGRTEEANRYLAMLQNTNASSAALVGLKMDLAVKQGDLKLALQLARGNAQQHVDDAFAQLWLGQTLQANGEKTEAEKAFREALRLAPQNPQIIEALLKFYVGANERNRAEEVLAAVKADEKLATIDKSRILAQGFDLLGNSAEAERYYRDAAQKDSNPEGGQLALAEFLLRKGGSDDIAEVEKWSREVLRSNAQFGRARRMLAQILVNRGGEIEWAEAEKLLSTSKDATNDSILNQRTAVLSLLRRGGRENLEKAENLLEKRIADPRLVSAEDRLLLARTLEMNGKSDQARQQLLRLAQQEKPKPNHLAIFVDFLLRRDEIKEAEEWVKKLEQTAPDEFSTIAIRARWLAANGQKSEIEPLVDTAAERFLKKFPNLSKADEAQLCLQVGNLYAALEQYPSAERWYRRVVESVPERYEPLASVLARQNRVSEAIVLCNAATTKDTSSAPALTLVGLLLAGKPSEDDFRAAEAVFEKTLKDHPEDSDFLRRLAGLRVTQKRIDDAVMLYRRILEREPRDIATMNNLATLLSEMPSQRKDGLKYINDAIGIAGPQPMLLDTKAMILYSDPQSNEATINEAISLFLQASALPEADPRYSFHLALAYQKAGEVEKARDALARAQKGRLSQQILTPTEQQLLSELEQELKAPPQSK